MHFFLWIWDPVSEKFTICNSSGPAQSKVVFIFALRKHHLRNVKRHSPRTSLSPEGRNDVIKMKNRDNQNRNLWVYATPCGMIAGRQPQSKLKHSEQECFVKFEQFQLPPGTRMSSNCVPPPAPPGVQQHTTILPEPGMFQSVVLQKLYHPLINVTTQTTNSPVRVEHPNPTFPTASIHFVSSKWKGSLHSVFFPISKCMKKCCCFFCQGPFFNQVPV